MIECVDKSGVIIARDCSPIPILRREDDEWLRKLVSAAKPADLLLQIGKCGDAPDDEPIAVFDSMSGTWWAGRYVGEVQFEGRTLRIEPRFGMPALMRWLATIWGVRLVDSKGKLEQQRIWLWLVVAHLWAGRLVAAAKHGVPFRRVDTIHSGNALRGKLLARATALGRAVGDDRLVSMTRTRVVDPVIGGILLATFQRLGNALGQRGEQNFWLPDRAKTVIDDLRAALGSHAAFTAIPTRSSIRYSPITESYRSVVDLSLSILQQRPKTSAPAGDGKAFGVLLDMAEIWELYVAKLLQVGLSGLQVCHTGRSTDHFRSLLTSAAGDDQIGSLRPDIIILDHHDRCLAIADAKYKTTRINAGNRTGVLRDDLYQLAAYLSGFGDPTVHLDGFLIYPTDEDGQVARRLSPKNPWKVTSAPLRNLWFLATNSGSDSDSEALTEDERAITGLIQTTIAAHRSPHSYMK